MQEFGSMAINAKLSMVKEKDASVDVVMKSTEPEPAIEKGLVDHQFIC
jgi:hypothetical protein